MYSEHRLMPWLCRVRRSASLVLFRIAIIVFVISLIWFAVWYIKYRMKREEEERQEVHKMADRIIDMLSKHQRACQTDKSLLPYQAIPHVRDSLIPPAERQKKQRLWNKAVQFLNTHESRVRVETQRIHGEEFPVWRWVQVSPTVSTAASISPISSLTSPLNLKPNRVWQGTAFDNPDTAVKRPFYSPTQCLKIRNMFDPSLESAHDWNVAIEDAVLERCGEDSNIVHVAVDKSSTEGCVYVKFTSQEMAGRGFRALHGSWFDGKLVTVKFLRLDRYHTRFPESQSATVPIKPSNDLKLSLAAINQVPVEDAL